MCLLGGLCTDGVFEFNVPSSTSTGGLQHPAPEFQFPVDRSSNQGESGGVGDDWRYLGTYANSVRLGIVILYRVLLLSLTDGESLAPMRTYRGL